MKKLSVFFLIFVAVAMLGGGEVFAQQPSLEEFVFGDIKNLKAEEQPEIASGNGQACFDFYKFQSVAVNAGAAKQEYVAGERASFEGEIVNKNDAPVINGNLFVRIGRKNPNFSEGNNIVDEFIPVKDIALDPNGKKQLEFYWSIPAEIANGEYKADYFFSVGNRFNLGGLPFSNEIVAGTSYFSVKSNQAGAVYFDRASTKVDGKKYNHVGDWPLVDAKKEIKIQQLLLNAYDVKKEVQVVYQLYSWDSLNKQDLIDSKMEEVIISAKGGKELSYSIPPASGKSVYYLKMSVVDEGVKSIVNIRIVTGENGPRLNYPALNVFPVESGEKMTLFSCFHNTANTDVTGGKVIVGLFDRDNKLIKETKYEGSITPSMGLVKDEFTFERAYDYFKIKAQIFSADGAEVDSYEAIYDCEKLDLKKCKTAGILAVSQGENPAKSNGKAQVLIWAFIGTALLVSLIIIVKKYFPRWPGGFSATLLFCLVSLSLFGAKAEAFNEKSASVTQDYTFMRNMPLGYVPIYNGHYTAVNTIGMTSGGTLVRSGAAINFFYDKMPPSLVFNGTGGYWDTPYGRWMDVEYMDDDDNLLPIYSGYSFGTKFYERDLFYNHFGMANFAADPPTVSMSSSDPGIISCSGMNCIANKSGTAVVTGKIGQINANAYVYFYDSMTSYALSKSLTFPAQSVSWTIRVDDSPAPTLDFSAAPPVIAPGGTSVITWNVGNAVSCIGSGGTIPRSVYDDDLGEYVSVGPNDGWAGPREFTNGAHTFNVSPAINTTYNLECFNAAGFSSGVRSVTVGVSTAPLTTLSVTTGSCGKVVSVPAGINCVGGSGSCSAIFAQNSPITLSASPLATCNFNGWSGACSGNSATCNLVMDLTKTANASFSPTCLPNSTCAADTCTGSTCGDGCGGTVPGTKSCTTSGNWREVAP